MRFKKYAPIFASSLALLAIIATSAIVKQGKPSAEKAPKPPTQNNSSSIDTPKAEAEEMRGVWVSYFELSMEKEKDKSEKGFRQKFGSIAKNCAEKGFNTLIVQVRPFCDALYKSDYYPWSHILSGTQGKNPGYDALKIMCEICRNHSLNIHAWVNPYRIKISQTPSELCDDNPYIKDDSIGKETDDGIFLDPSNEEARKLIINGLTELAKNYDIDGIQFDDYFYPTQDEEFDADEYSAYVEKMGKDNSMSLDNWRLANVNMLVCEAYRAIKKANKDIVFGISPQGNLKNNDTLYADVRAWCTCRGFIDYICPQIYFSPENPALTFDDALDEWCSLSFYGNIKLYVGLAGYKAGSEDDEGTWLDSNTILRDEYLTVRKNNRTEGIMLYSYSSLLDDNSKEEIDNLVSAFK